MVGLDTIIINKYFYDIKELIDYLNGDLSNCDLSKATISKDDIKGCITNENTRLPFFNLKNRNIINTHIRNEITNKVNLDYEPVSFKETIENEEKTQLKLYEKRNSTNESDINYTKISYVSDIHLIHKLKKYKSKDVIIAIQDIINNLLKDITVNLYTMLYARDDILLIGGDVSSDFNLYKLFINELSKKIKGIYTDLKIIFILGNHELWDFENNEIKDIVNAYKNLILSNGMYFVHNNLLYIENNLLKEISEDELDILSYNEIRNRLTKCNLIISGGLAFSGYNNEFNANNGIYRNIINREQEIEETKKFEKIYHKLTKCIYDKNVIIFTHTPKKDWSNSEEYMKNWVYVSGHTHRNYFHDDGEYRIYSDNQLGYKYKKAFVKSFYIEYDYDIFSDYENGIYNITKEQYHDFHRGKNIRMDYNREGEIFMLKKNGYYCFIKPTARGKLSILHGGTLKTLNIKDINYYYDNMDSQISIYKEPLDKYTDYQKNVANCVKEIGGDGRIHGCIIDIDFFNHIYVNPEDFKLTGYSASDIIEKYVYANIPSLLKSKCPLLYENYQKKLGISESNALIQKGQSTEIILEPTYYPNTDIYKASRKIKKMQRLNNGILTVWRDDNRKFLN